MPFNQTGINSLTAHRQHEEIINSPNAYSLTLTLNPRKNKLMVGPQYSGLLKQVKQMVMNGNHLFDKLMINPEMTKECNIHFHIYFIASSSWNEDELHCLIKLTHSYDSYLGQVYKLKKIDSVTDELKNYPFKDTGRTITAAQYPRCKFNPHHIIFIRDPPIIYTPQNDISVKITINDFIKFINSQKKYLVFKFFFFY